MGVKSGVSGVMAVGAGEKPTVIVYFLRPRLRK
jgi:hypothetical protein